MDNINRTYINVYRSLLSWRWYKNVNVTKVFLHCLLKANYKNKTWEDIEIKQGEFITSSEHLADETGLTRQKVRTALKKLEKTGELTIKPTKRYTRIIVNNFSSYQNGEMLTNQQTNQQLTNKQPTGNQQVTTTNKDNKDNKDNKIINNTLDFFNTSLNSNYKNDEDEAYITYLKKLIRKGYTEKDFKIAIEKCINAWTNTPLEKNLRPTVIFNAKKFSEKLNMPVQTYNNYDDKQKDTFSDIDNPYSNYSEKELEKLASRKPSRKKPKDTFSDIDSRLSDYTAEELDKIARRKSIGNSETAEELDNGNIYE